MSREEERSEDLKAFEAALAALFPRVEGFDRERLIYEAGRASGRAESRERRVESQEPGRRRSALDSRPSTLRHWAWPGAFSAMTAVAATLLAMLLMRPEPQMATQAVSAPVAEDTLATRHSPPATGHSPLATGHSPLATGNSPLATGHSSEPPAVGDRGIAQRALMHGIDLSAQPVLPRSGGLQMASVPASVRELQRELMKESAPNGGAPSRSTLPWFSPFGERS